MSIQTDLLTDSTGLKSVNVGDVVDGRCTAWVRYDTLTGAVISSFNISSITLTATGRRTVVLSTPMVNLNYAVTATCSSTSSNMIVPTESSDVPRTLTTFEIHTGYANVTLWSANGYTTVAIFGGK